MKIAAFILSITVLFLAFKPGLNLIPLPEVTEHAGCGAQCESSSDFDGYVQSSIPKGCCDENGCNPLRLCCSIVLFFSETTFMKAKNQDIAARQVFAYRSIHNSLFIEEFWQPPKFV